MGWLLNAAYAFALLAYSPWLVLHAWRDGKYRDGLAAKLFGQGDPRWHPGRRCVWFHAVSLGEVNALATVLTRFRAERPDLEFVISTTTRTGFETAQNRYGEDHLVFYCPLDFTWAVDRVLRRIQPDMLVLAELELWPNLIRQACRRDANVAIINGRLSANSHRGYRRIRWGVARVLRRVAWIGCQTDEYAERFVSLGASRSAVDVTGSVKFDGAVTDRMNAATNRLKQLAQLPDGQTVWLAGSTCEPEEEHVLRAFDQLESRSQVRLILVPRHPERFEAVAELLDRSGHSWVRRSELGDGRHSVDREDWRILLVDTVGELTAWWGLATIGFVGGSMGARGGQNMIEPSAYGVTVCFGPKTENFRDVVQQLLAAEGATVVHDAKQLAQFVEDAVADPATAAEQGRRARRLVLSNVGATERTVKQLSRLVPSRHVETPLPSVQAAPDRRSA